MQAVPGVPQAGLGQFLELFKMQFLMKMMNGDGRQTTSGSLWTMVILFFWDQFAKSAPAMFALAYAYVQRTYFPDQKAIKDLPLMPSTQQPPPQKTTQACIQFERTVDTKAVDPRIEAVMHHVCTLPDVRSLRYNGVEMIPNFKDMIMIDNDIWFEILNPQLNPMVSSTANGGQAPKQEPILYRLSTYDHDITWLHKFVEQAMERFEQEKKNKLGSESYYFDHITGVAGPYRNPLSPSHCTFSKSKFQSNRVLNNVYLRQIDELAERVQFFMRRRDWYDAKGIPHTLGIVMYGHPGCGKTSTIKAIANETKRHIFNISLGAIKTKEAIKDLFYNDNVNILQDGKMEMLNIPIKQRVYVIEDIDAMDSVVVKRSAEDTEKEQERKLKLDAEIEWLKQTQGKDVAQRMIQGKDEKEEDKLDLATLLNVLDGVRETPGRIIILSTNYPERLDEALLRPGRFDMMLEFEKHNAQVLKLHLERHYDTKLTDAQWKRINIPALHFKWTPAEVSQILFRRIGNVDLAIDDLVKEDPKQLFKFSQLSKEQKATEEVKCTEDNEGTDLTALLDIQDKVSEPSKPSVELLNPSYELGMIHITPKHSVVVKGSIRELYTEEPIPDEILEKLFADADKELEWLDKECNVLESIKAPHREYLKNVRSSIDVWKNTNSPIKNSSMQEIVSGFYTQQKSWRELHPMNGLHTPMVLKLFNTVELVPHSEEVFTQEQIAVAQDTLQKLNSLLNQQYEITERRLASTSMDETMRNALTRYKEYMTDLSKTLQSKDLIHPVRNLLTYREDLKTFLKAVKMNAEPASKPLKNCFAMIAASEP
ncbi:MAG: ATP-binding protein [Bacteroidetes bacterium]|nr:ATP-binding protein [Bacteroidota bacterium]